MQTKSRRVFKTGGSVAIRLPKEFNIHEDDVIEMSLTEKGEILLKPVNAWAERMKAISRDNEESGEWDDFIIERSTETREVPEFS